jgi:hypothetical protein
MNESTHINTYEELRDHAATMGMVFFGLRYGKAHTGRRQYMDIGISICDVITKGPTLSEVGVTSYEDLAVVEAFRAIEHQTGSRTDKLKDLEDDAPSVRKILERLHEGESVPVEELDRSANFFRRIYSAT